MIFLVKMNNYNEKIKKVLIFNNLKLIIQFPKDLFLFLTVNL